MPQSFSEPPIPPYAVVLTNPDSGEVLFDVNLPAASGTREQCQDFIGAHEAPAGYQLDIIHIDTGRLVSWTCYEADHMVQLSLAQCIRHN